MSDPNDLLTDEDLLALITIARKQNTEGATIAAMRRYLTGGVWVTITPQQADLGAATVDMSTGRLVLCLCPMISGGQRALNQACPVHGQEKPITTPGTKSVRDLADFISRSYPWLRSDVEAFLTRPHTGSAPANDLRENRDPEL